MRKLSALPILLLLALLPDAAGAQFVGIPTTVAQLPDCTAGRHGRIWVVRDAVGNGDCSVGGGTDAAMCLCSAEGFVPIIASSTPGANSITESMLKAVDAAADEECLTYEGTVGDFEWQTCGSAGIGGSTGATDNAILRADGTGGATLQNSPVTIADTTGAMAGPSATNWTLTATGTGKGLLLGTDGVAGVFLSSAILRARSDYYFAFATGTDPTGTTGATIKYNGAAGQLLITDSSGTNGGKLLTGKLVEANTAGSGTPNAIAAGESGTVFTNEGATAKNYEALPSAVAGYQFTFIVQDTDGMRVVANTGDDIRIGATTSTTAGYCESTTVGDSVTLIAINATTWAAVALVGSGWTCA